MTSRDHRHPEAARRTPVLRTVGDGATGPAQSERRRPRAPGDAADNQVGAAELTVVTGIIGSEKLPFFDDAEVGAWPCHARGVPLPLSDQARVVAGAVGVALVTAAWAGAGLATEGFDPVVKSVSQLHRDGTATRGLLSAGLLAYAGGMLLVAPVVGRALDSPACRALATIVGVVTATAAVFPLAVDKGLPQDLPHMVSAAIGYVCVSVLPLLGAWRLRGRERVASYAVGAVTATAMALTVPLHDVSGGLQRVGLTLGSAWVVAVAYTWSSSPTERRRAACSEVGVSTPR